MNYPTMKVSELRCLVRERGLASGLVVAGARKALLLEALALGRWPDGKVDSEASLHGGLVSAYWKSLEMTRAAERDPGVYRDDTWTRQYYYLQGRLLEALNGLDRGPRD